MHLNLQDGTNSIKITQTPGYSFISAPTARFCCRWDMAVAEMTGGCADKDISSGAPILGALGLGSSASGCLLKAKGVARLCLIAEASELRQWSL